MKDRQFGSIVAKVKADNPDAIYATGYYFTAGPLVSQLRAGGVTVSHHRPGRLRLPEIHRNCRRGLRRGDHHHLPGPRLRCPGNPLISSRPLKRRPVSRPIWWPPSGTRPSWWPPMPSEACRFDRSRQAARRHGRHRPEGLHRHHHIQPTGRGHEGGADTRWSKTATGTTTVIDDPALLAPPDK